MARARNIKHSFFTNEQLADNCPLGRLLFIGLWTIADFKGDLEWKERTIKIQLLPWDDCDVKQLAINLDKSGLIRFYSDGDRIYVNVINFDKHQNPHKNERQKGSSIPKYTEEMRQLIDLKGLAINRDKSGLNQECSHSDRADSLILIPDSLSLNPESLNLNPDISPSARATKPDYPEWFDYIWQAYPSRAGGNNKKLAYQKAKARIKDGRSEQDLLTAVDRYRNYISLTGKAGTEFVKQASTFFGSLENIDNDWKPPIMGAGNYAGQPKSPIERFMQEHYPESGGQEHNRPVGGNERTIRGEVVESVRGESGRVGPVEKNAIGYDPLADFSSH